MIGLVELWMSGGLSENNWLISQFMSGIFSSSSPSVSTTAGRLVWGTVGVIVAVRLAVTSASLLGFLSKVEVIVAKVRD